MQAEAGLGLGLVGMAAAIGVGMIFIHAGTSKLRHRALMPGIVANYRLLPAALVPAVAVALPIVEVAVGIGLITGIGAAAAIPAAVLLLTFALAMAINIARGRRQIDCGCGRPQLRQPLRWSLVARNLVLAALVSTRLVAVPAPAGLDLAAAIAGGASLLLLTALFDAIAALAASPLAVKRS